MKQWVTGQVAACNRCGKKIQFGDRGWEHMYHGDAEACLEVVPADASADTAEAKPEWSVGDHATCRFCGGVIVYQGEHGWKHMSSILDRNHPGAAPEPMEDADQKPGEWRVGDKASCHTCGNPIVLAERGWRHVSDLDRSYHSSSNMTDIWPAGETCETCGVSEGCRDYMGGMRCSNYEPGAIKAGDKVGPGAVAAAAPGAPRQNMATHSMTVEIPPRAQVMELGIDKRPTMHVEAGVSITFPEGGTIDVRDGLLRLSGPIQITDKDGDLILRTQSLDIGPGATS